MLNDAALVVGANAIDVAITHFQAHSSGTNPAANAVGSRVAVNGTVDADGDITWTGVNFTGLGANGPVTYVSYWSASSAGTSYGGFVPSGDTTANSAGEFSITTATETSTAI